MQGNPQHHSMAVFCQQHQLHWHHLTGRCPLQMLSHSNPGLPWSALACQARGQHPVSSGCHQPQAYLQHKSLLPSRGKIQCSEYVDLSELLVYDFQYRYSSLDDSQALEIIDGKLSLAPKCRARHLSTLQLWLWAWHACMNDTLLSFYPYRYLELSHYWHHISDLDQHFHWAAMLSYDAQFHDIIVQSRASHSVPLISQLYITTL